MRFKRFLFVLIVIVSCTKKNDYGHIMVIGHGGMGLDQIMSIYHDNSFESIDLALQFPGINGCEVDVQMDFDGELWLCHDVDLSSALGVDTSIPECHTLFLEELVYQTIHEEKLCKLRDVIHLFDNSMHLFVDLKSYDQSSGIIVDPALLKEALDDALIGAVCQVSVILLNESWLPCFVSNYQTYLDADTKSSMDSNLSLYPELSGFVVRSEVLSGSEIEEYKSQGYKVFLYEMRSPKGIRMALDKNPNGIIPDDIRRALVESR